MQVGRGSDSVGQQQLLQRETEPTKGRVSRQGVVLIPGPEKACWLLSLPSVPGTHTIHLNSIVTYG